MTQNETEREDAPARKGRRQAAKEIGEAAEAREAQGVAEAAKTGALDQARIVTALRAAGDKKAVEPVVLDLRELASFTDYFVIASGTNARQVQAIADEIVERLKDEGTRPERVEGHRTAEWVLIDYGDFLVHVFEAKARRFYDLERLWREAARVELPAELAGEPAAGGEAERGA